MPRLRESLRTDKFSSVSIFGLTIFQKQHMFSLCGGDAHLILGSTREQAFGNVGSLEFEKAPLNSGGRVSRMVKGLLGMMRLSPGFAASPRSMRTGEPPLLLMRPIPRFLKAAYARDCLLTT